MYQENAQGSNNIAQKIPSFVDEFGIAASLPTRYYWTIR
jgi:hypothetical protein